MSIDKINRTGTLNTADKQDILNLLDKIVEFGVFNEIDTFSTTQKITGIVSCTQAEYDGLSEVLSGVLYVIIEE